MPQEEMPEGQFFEGLERCVDERVSANLSVCLACEADLSSEQVRSCDEGMAIFKTCTRCNHIYLLAIRPVPGLF